MTKVCLISVTASHYRSLIYNLMDKRLVCDFIFGKDDTTVKQMDISSLTNSQYLQNKFFCGTQIYYQKDTVSKTPKYTIIINDLGIFCMTSWLLLLLTKFRRQKIYHWDHGWYGREGFLKKWIKRLYFGLADGAFIYGNYARNLMIKNGFDGKKLHVIHNSLDYDRQLMLRNSITTSSIYSDHFNNNNPVICFIGRLTPVKKLDQIIKAISILKEKGEKYNVVFIGDGSERDTLEHQIEILKLNDQVWFFGACYDEKKNAELLYNADLCIAPGNIGLTAIHAMMFGCPCISHNDFPWQMPEFEAIQKGITGDFFNRDNVESLSNTISNWFSLQIDNRKKVRQACYKEIDERWNPYKQIEIIIKVLGI